MNKKRALHDEIARAAYELYETRGRAHGHDFDDWIMAEKVVTGKHERHAKEIGQEVDSIRKGREVFRR